MQFLVLDEFLKVRHGGELVVAVRTAPSAPTKG